MRLSHTPLPSGLSPSEAFLRVRRLPGALLLESTARGQGMGRHSFVAADPFATVSANLHGTSVTWADGVTELRDQPPLRVLGELLERFSLDPSQTTPAGTVFPGGAAGWLSYELGASLHGLDPPRGHDPETPLMEVGLYDVVLGWDHEEDRAWLVSTGFPERAREPRERRARRRLERFLDLLASEIPKDGRASEIPGDAGRALRAPSPPCAPGPGLHPVPGLPGARSTFSWDGYCQAVERVRELILRGDIFQANLSQRFETSFSGDPFGLYRRLSRSHPSPFAGYVETGSGTVVSASPESFLRVRGGRVEARPIKGTMRRSPVAEEDEALARRLLDSEKDRAENVMIVDLLRNDVSRACREGSVRASALCVVESHPTVHHLVSTVEVRLARGQGPADLVRAAFPGGSITGAPKLRAMEILTEIEPTPRGVYTGSLGWLGFDGDMELSIAIRTIRIRDATAHVQAGGGVVLDSDPLAEWRESLEKVRGLLAALLGEDEGAPGVNPGGRTSGAGVPPGLPPEVVSHADGWGSRTAHRPRVAVLDHRDSFVHNLARYLRELGARAQVFRADQVSVEELEAMDPTHLVLSPGPCTPMEFPLSDGVVRAFAGRVPVLGVCLGHLCIAHALGGKWSRARRPRHGKASPIHHDGTGLFRGLPDGFSGALYHSLALSSGDLPEGFRVVASTKEGEVMAVADEKRRIWGLQFHPESVLTARGRVLLGNFLEERVEGPDLVAVASEGSAGS